MRSKVFTIASSISVLVALGLGTLWFADPGQFYYGIIRHYQYDLWVLQGRISFTVGDLKRQGIAPYYGVQTIFDLPIIWPILAATLLPVCSLVRSMRQRRQAPKLQGFPVLLESDKARNSKQ
jgi:hypothetical protein